MMKQLWNDRRGQGLVEYALIIAGVALICAVGISLFGHKTAGMVDAVAVVLPGAHADDNGPINQGQLIETTGAGNGSIGLDLNAIQQETNSARLGQNVAGSSSNAFNGLVADPNASSGS
jgi:pilus assembly protein Flp/PilA